MVREIEPWMDALCTRLLAVFGERLVYLGLQGSYRRGEADAASDIDVVTVLDTLAVEDLMAYQDVVSGMDEAEKACGFICGLGELESWPKYEQFQLLRDTRDWHGCLAELLPGTGEQELREAVRIGAANLYHALCHDYLYENRAERSGRLMAAYKQTFYLLRMLHYLETGVYADTRAALLEHLTGGDRAVLELAIALKTKPEGERYDIDAAYNLLLRWCSTVLRGLDANLSRENADFLK